MGAVSMCFFLAIATTLCTPSAGAGHHYHAICTAWVQDACTDFHQETVVAIQTASNWFYDIYWTRGDPIELWSLDPIARPWRWMRTMDSCMPLHAIVISSSTSLRQG